MGARKGGGGSSEGDRRAAALMVGGAGRSRQRGARGSALGLRRGEGRFGDVSELRGKTLGGQGREKERGAVGRVVTTSPWRFGGHPHLACRERRHLAGSRSFREEPGAERAGGAARERRVAGGLDSVGNLGSAQNRGGRESRENRERERNRGLIQIRIFPKNFLLKHGKL